MSQESKELEIFFHVGLGKTASTYLQNSVFPKLKGVHYIPTNQYRHSLKILQKKEKGRFLVSREFDTQFEREVSKFCQPYPDSKIIIVFRRHDQWIASQYRRHVKNGYHEDFTTFMDIRENKGKWKKEELIFMNKLTLIEKYSTQKPLILFHEDIKDHPVAFIDKIANYLGATYDLRDISLKPVHTSYNDKQLKAVKKFARRFVKKVPYGYHNRILNWLLFRPWWAFYHLVMYVAYFLPESWIGKEPLIPQKELEAIRTTFQQDWEMVKQYAERR